MPPAVLLSTMAPLPPPVRRSLWLASVITAITPVAPNSLTLTPTASTANASASWTKRPALSVPALSALSVCTAVLMARSAVPMASSACRRSALAVTFVLLPAAFRMLPASETTLTWWAVTSPSETSPLAFSRTLLPVAVMAASPAMVRLPPSASRLTVPVVAMFTPLLSNRSALALRVMWPLPLAMLLLTTTSPPVDCTRMEPLPSALTATLSSSAPSLSVTVPPASRTTEAFWPVMRSCHAPVTVLTSDGTAALVRLTSTATVSTATASVSLR